MNKNESQTITLTCEMEGCQKITNKIKIYDYYVADFKRIIKHSNNYCLECYQKQKEAERKRIKETGEIKGFKIN